MRCAPRQQRTSVPARWLDLVLWSVSALCCKCCGTPPTAVSQCWRPAKAATPASGPAWMATVPAAPVARGVTLKVAWAAAMACGTAWMAGAAPLAACRALCCAARWASRVVSGRVGCFGIGPLKAPALPARVCLTLLLLHHDPSPPTAHTFPAAGAAAARRLLRRAGPVRLRPGSPQCGCL